MSPFSKKQDQTNVSRTENEKADVPRPRAPARADSSAASELALRRTRSSASGLSRAVTGGGHGLTRKGRFQSKTTPPQEPEWAKLFPGAYDEKRVVKLNGTKLKWAIQIIAGLAILFYGYDQGVMSGVNNQPNYKRLMGTDSDLLYPGARQSQRDSAAIGGIVAIYYLGTLIGGLLGGWLGDKIGRVKTILFGCAWAVLGAALQSSAQNIVWMMFARVITGVGTGNLNAIVPVWTAELSTHDARGAALGFEFFLNILGLALAYWIEYGVRDKNPSFAWRFPLAFQEVFLIMLLFTIPFFPESPRWLAKMGREDEARRLLARLRTETNDEDSLEVENELYDIMEVVEVERTEEGSNNYIKMMTVKDAYNTRRRVWLTIWLQIMQELVGIGVITVYAPTAFQQAGYTSQTADLLSGINDTVYAFSVLIAVITLDRYGRRNTLYVGALIMALSLIICTFSGKYSLQYNDMGNTGESKKWGGAVTFGIFLYTSTFGATWLTVPWLYPTEIFPLSVRAKGGAYSVIGWSIGNGIVTEITPFLFNAITYWTFLLFALLNIFCLPFVWAWYPETAGRTLEEMDVLFSGPLYVPAAEKLMQEIENQDPDIMDRARRGDKRAFDAALISHHERSTPATRRNSADLETVPTPPSG